VITVCIAARLHFDPQPLQRHVLQQPQDRLAADLAQHGVLRVRTVQRPLGAGPRGALPFLPTVRQCHPGHPRHFGQAERYADEQRTV
jgi:hypothetical protein